MMRTFLLTVLSTFVCTSGIFAQTTTSDDFVNQSIRQFQHLDKIPNEKVYLHLDKPYYSAGENIWYAGYLTNGISLQLSPYSKYIYVELINKNDSIRFRYKIRVNNSKDSLGFAGCIPLPPDMPAGDYHLRAYSWWMQNAGPDYFFQKNIRVGNAIDKLIQSTIHYSQNGDKQLTADINFSSSDKISFNKRIVNYKVYEGRKLLRSHSSSLDAQGHLRIGFDFSQNSKEQYSIQLAFDDATYNYQNTFYLPKGNTSFDCQFFPEGGNLLSNGMRTIAFKAIGQNGLSVNVNGTVFNQRGDSIQSFSTKHDGMGSFSLFVPDTIGTTYYAKVRMKDNNLWQTIKLPPVVNTGIGLIMRNYNGKLNYEIIMSNKQALPKRLYLLGQIRGKLVFLKAITDSLQWNGAIATTAFPVGIAHFLLLNEQCNALSERLIFVNRPSESEMEITSDKKEYVARQPVNLKLILNNRSDSLVSGQFSLSVTEDKTVKLDSLADNIYSNLLLTSDLKGYIEDPAYYFNHKNANTEQMLDLVMLTHGWSRFSVPSILQNKFPENNYFLEEGQSFSGKITNMIGKGAKDAQLIVMGMKGKILKSVAADDKGEFVVDGISFPDSTLFIVQGRSKRGHTTVDVVMDKEQFPDVTSLIPFSASHIDKTQEDAYMGLMSQKFHYEGGERVYHIKEVTVTASKIVQYNDNPLYAGLGNPVRTADIDKRFSSSQSVLDILRTFPGVRIIGSSISIRGSKRNPMVMIDDMPYSDDDDDMVNMLSLMNASDISYVNVLKGADTSIFGYGGGNGVIIINFRSGADFTPGKLEPRGIAIIRPLGYYKSAQFYSPKYQTTEQINNPNPDLRTTIYWNPSFLINKANPARLSFYTADRSGFYTVTVEGVTNRGEPIHKQAKLYIKEQ
jgi:hypothetical protein